MFIKVFASLVLMSSASMAEGPAACDINKMREELSQLKASLKEKFDSAFQADAEFSADISDYGDKVNEFRKCQLAHGEELNTCQSHGFDLISKPNAFITLNRLILLDGDNVTCNVPKNDVFFAIRNYQNRQTLTYYNGMVVSDMSYLCKGQDGIVTDRGFVLVDGSKASESKSAILALDFAKNMDDFKTSQFWGIMLDVGEPRGPMTRSYSDALVTFTWKNGAFVTFDTKFGKPAASNFYGPHVYAEDCVTETDNAPGAKRHYWPGLTILESGKKLISDPYVVKKRSSDSRGISAWELREKFRRIEALSQFWSVSK